MLQLMARMWWAVALRGIVAVVFGILALVAPGIGLLTLVLLFGMYALADGILSVIGSFQEPEARSHRWLALIEGSVSILAGLVAIFSPGIAAIALVYVIAAWALLTGILEIVAAVRLREQIHGEWIMGLAGIASIAFGVIMLIAPAAGALALTWFVGAYALVFGVLLIGLAFRLRGLAQHPERQAITA
jgi:uncharacterized membrane protein HdeD (DUF308 family)